MLILSLEVQSHTRQSFIFYLTEGRIEFDTWNVQWEIFFVHQSDLPVLRRRSTLQHEAPNLYHCPSSAFPLLLYPNLLCSLPLPSLLFFPLLFVTVFPALTPALYITLTCSLLVLILLFSTNFLFCLFYFGPCLLSWMQTQGSRANVYMCVYQVMFAQFHYLLCVYLLYKLNESVLNILSSHIMYLATKGFFLSMSV